MAAHVFTQMSEQCPNLECYEVDVEDLSDVAEEIGIRTVPSFFVYQGDAKRDEILSVNIRASRRRLAGIAEYGDWEYGAAECIGLSRGLECQKVRVQK